MVRFHLFARHGRWLWDFRIGIRRVYYTPWKPIAHGDKLEKLDWPFVTIKAEATEE